MEKELHVFDLDKTLLTENSGMLFGAFLCRKKVLPSFRLAHLFMLNLLHKYFNLSLIALHESACRSFFKNSTLEQLKSYAEEFWREYFPKKMQLFIWSELQKAQGRGDLVAIFSSSSDFLVEGIATRLGVEHWVATDYTVVEGKIQGIKTLIDGKKKAELLVKLAQEKGIQADRIVAYSDSFMDIPFLEQAARSFAVRPDDKLRFYAKKKGWSILD